MIRRATTLTAKTMMEQVDKNQTIDETKSKLKASRQQLEAELEYQLQDIKRDAASVGKQILIVGGGLYLSYKLIKSLTTGKKKKQERKKRHHQDSKKKDNGTSFGQMLMHQLVTMAVVALSAQVKEAFNKNKGVNDQKQHS